MKYVPGTSMEQWYINSYGYDLRELDHAMTWTRNKSFDEKKFAQDPAGQEGGADRMMFNLHLLRYFHYMEGLEHLFNTGQVESCNNIHVHCTVQMSSTHVQ